MMFKNNLFRTIMLLCFTLVSSHVALAADDKNFMIPLDTNASQKVNLQVAIPNNFKAVPPPPNSPVRIFIPNNETADEYSEIITVSPLENSNLTASQYIDALISGTQKNAADFKVVEKNTQQARNIEETVAIVTYKSPSYNNRDEISIFYATSGPSGLASVQYIIAVKPNDKIENLTQNLYDFIKKNTSFQG